MIHPLVSQCGHDQEECKTRYSTSDVDRTWLPVVCKQTRVCITEVRMVHYSDWTKVKVFRHLRMGSYPSNVIGVQGPDGHRLHLYEFSVTVGWFPYLATTTLTSKLSTTVNATIIVGTSVNINNLVYLFSRIFLVGIRLLKSRNAAVGWMLTL